VVLLDIHSFPTRRSSDLQEIGNEIGIFYSGGVDSEVVVQSLLDIDVPFTAYFIKFEDDMNKHDYEFTKRFVDKHSLKLETLNIKDRKSTRLNSSHVKISY